MAQLSHVMLMVVKWTSIQCASVYGSNLKEKRWQVFFNHHTSTMGSPLGLATGCCNPMIWACHGLPMIAQVMLRLTHEHLCYFYGPYAFVGFILSHHLNYSKINSVQCKFQNVQNNNTTIFHEKKNCRVFIKLFACIIQYQICMASHQRNCMHCTTPNKTRNDLRSKQAQ